MGYLGFRKASWRSAVGGARLSNRVLDWETITTLKSIRMSPDSLFSLSRVNDAFDDAFQKFVFQVSP